MKIVAITPQGKFDYLVSCIIEGLQSLDIELICSGYGNGELDTHNDTSILHNSKDADFIFVFWGKRGIDLNLVQRIGMLDKMVYLDGSEWTHTGHPYENQVKLSKKDPSLKRGEPWLHPWFFNNVKWYFKRECYPEDSDLGIIPLPFGLINNCFTGGNLTVEKSIDVSCVYGQMNDGLRLETYNFCNTTLKQLGYKVHTTKTSSNTEFLNVIAKSYLSVDAWGGGQTCHRFWEIVANKTACVSQKYTIDFPNEFEDGVNYISYSNINEFEHKVLKYLKDKDECIEIGKRGYEHAVNYHTPEKRVEYIFNNVI